MEKTCSKCGENKHFNEYRKLESGKLASTCKICRAVYYREYRAKKKHGIDTRPKCQTCGTHVDKKVGGVFCSEECRENKPYKENMVGMVFGSYTVIGYYGWRESREYWNCQCSCERKTINKVAKRALLAGRSKSCGCLPLQKMRDSRFNDLSGQIFGRLTVIKRVPMPEHWSRSGNSYNKMRHRTAYLCRCNHGSDDTPTDVIVEAEKLKSGRTQSCGCMAVRVGADNPTWRSVEVECAWCKKIFHRQPWRLDKNLNNFCRNSCFHKFAVGENASAWLGGKSFEPYPVGWRESFKTSIRRRDGDKCVMCGKTKAEIGRNMSVHHIDYNKNNIHPHNLVALCHICHGKTNHNREDWIEYFKNLRGLSETG